MKRNFRADYTCTIADNVIADQGNRSVTNDIDNVVADIKGELANDLSGHAIIYRDSQGVWDGVMLDESGSVSFYGLEERDQSKAAARLLHLVP